LKVAVLIPSRGDRNALLIRTIQRIEKSTRLPDFLELVNYTPDSNRIDLSERLKAGYSVLRDKTDLILIIEDDDWYSEHYINMMCDRWLAEGEPDLIGISNTLYYHIFSQRYVQLKHPGHSSLCCTGIKGGLDINFGKPGNAFVDMHLFGSGMSKFLFGYENIMVGIKHGIGRCGGAAHKPDGGMFKHKDNNFEYLRSIVGNESADFYKTLCKQMN